MRIKAALIGLFAVFTAIDPAQRNSPTSRSGSWRPMRPAGTSTSPRASSQTN